MELQILQSLLTDGVEWTLKHGIFTDKSKFDMEIKLPLQGISTTFGGIEIICDQIKPSAPVVKETEVNTLY